MSSKFIVPIEITNFSSTPDIPGNGFVRIYTLDSWLKILYSNGTEKDAVLDRPLDNFSLPLLASSVNTSDTVLEAFAKLQKTIDSIRLTGDAIGTGSYIGGEFVIQVTTIGGGSLTGPANQVLATPDGLAGSAALRSLVADDLPIIPIYKGGTGLSTLGSALQAIRVDVSGTFLEYYTPSLVGSLDDLSDVIITTPNPGELLIYNGANWENILPDYAGITTVDINLWNTAVGWGDHSLAGYVKKTDRNYQQSLSTGIISGGVVTINGVDNTKIDIAAGTGVIVDSWTDPQNPITYDVSWTAKTAETVTYLTTDTFSYIYIDNTGAVFQENTAPTGITRRDYILLARLGHTNLTTVNSIVNSYEVAQSPVAQFRDFAFFVEPVNSGNIISPNGANLSINKTSGKIFDIGSNYPSDTKNPNIVTIASATAPSLRLRTQTGNGSTSTTLDVANYDNAGTITAVGANKFTNQRVYLFPNGNIVVQYGQTVYNTMAAASAGLATESFVKFINVEDAVLIAVITVKSNATDLTDSSQAEFHYASKFGEIGLSGAGSTTATLQDIYDNSPTPEILTDASRIAFSVRQGSGSDLDNIYEGLNGLGSVVFSVNGLGEITNGTWKGNAIADTYISSASNWNTAYGWGDHALAGYLTSESDPIFLASAAAGITGTDITNWNTAFGWGNHASAGYYVGNSGTIRALLSETITGIDYNNSTGVFSLTTGYVIPTTTEESNWNTAFGWGNHASAGYLTTINGIAAGGELSGTYANPSLVNSAVTGKVLTGLSVTGSTITSTDTILQAFGKLQNQLNAVVGAMNYQSTWDASTNTPTLVSSTGTKGYVYYVSTSGSTNLDGITDWKTGDFAVFNGTTWDKWDATDAVTSVNGYVGTVVLTKSDVGLSNVENTALSTWAGSTNLTTLGTVVTGTWNASIISAAKGGTGIDTSASSGYAKVTTGTWSIISDATLKLDLSLNNVENTALSTWAGSTNITTLGTIGTGTWNGNTIGIGYGGTNITTYTTGDILYASATNVLSKLAATTDGYVLTLAGGVPTWAAGGSGSPAGSSTYIQYNTSGAFDASADFTYDNTTKILALGSSGAGINLSTADDLTVGYKIGNTFIARYQATNKNYWFNAANPTGITSASNNFFAGVSSGASEFSGQDITSGSYNVAIGGGNNLTTGGSNFALGIGSLNAATTTNQNIAIGVNALNNINTGGGDNIAIGHEAGGGIGNNDSANIAIGWRAMFTGGTGSGNIAIGSGALRDGSTTGNIVLGQDAARQANTSASHNVVLGYYSAINLRSAYHVIIGSQAYQSMSVSAGNGSIAIGYSAGFNNSTGVNTYIGYRSGYTNVGTANVFLGYDSGYAETTTSNTLIIANSSASTTEIIKGNFSEKWVRIQDTLRFTGIASNPGTSETGHIYYNTTDLKHKWYDGTNTVALSPDVIKPITIPSPTATDNFTVYYTARAITIRKIFDVVVGSSTPSVDWNIYHATTRDSGSPNTLFAADRTTSSTSGANTTTFNDATIPAGSYIWIKTSAVSGTVDELNVAFLITED